MQQIYILETFINSKVLSILGSKPVNQKMVEEFTKKVDKSVIVASPKDEILEGVIVKIERGTLKEFLDESVYTKFDNLDQDTLKVYFEVKFNDRLISGNDKFGYYDEPMANSTMAKILEKYENLGVGQKIKVIYNSKGFGKIKVD